MIPLCKHFNNFFPALLLCLAFATMYGMEGEEYGMKRMGGELLDQLEEMLGEPNQANVERVFWEAVATKNATMVNTIVDHYCGYLSPEILSKAHYYAWATLRDNEIMLAVARCSEPIALDYLRSIDAYVKAERRTPAIIDNWKTYLYKMLEQAAAVNHLAVVEYILRHFFTYITPEVRIALNAPLERLMRQAMQKNDKKTIVALLYNFSDYLSPDVRYEVIQQYQGDREIMALIPWYLIPPVPDVKNSL